MLLFVSMAAHAGPSANLEVTHTFPATTDVDTSAALSVKVANIGSKDALNVTLTVQLPKTHTSPTVYVLGDLGTYDARCTKSGTTLTCALGTVKKFKSTTVAVNFTPPWADEDLVFTSSVTTTSVESPTTNNSDTDTLIVGYIDTEILGPVDVTNDHCTGTGLVAFFECETAPSSIMSHDSVFESDNTITFPIEPDCTGTWSQPTLDHLTFEYTCLGDVVANFEGDGIGGDCFDGLTLFPNSTYVSPYRVCLVP
jgi:Domain of unknown function DUF11